MSYKMKHFELDKNWSLDDWPDEVSLSHKTRPSVSRKYVLTEGSVVHCCDCKHADWFAAVGVGAFQCTVHGWVQAENTDNFDGFCAWGERR